MLNKWTSVKLNKCHSIQLLNYLEINNPQTTLKFIAQNHKIEFIILSDKIVKEAKILIFISTNLYLFD